MPAVGKQQRFEAEIKEGKGGGAYVVVPFSVPTSLGPEVNFGQWVESAKPPETRGRRIGDGIARIGTATRTASARRPGRRGRAGAS